MTFSDRDASGKFHSYATEDFWATYRKLPRTVRQQAKLAYRQFLSDPRHPGLRFKAIANRPTYYSARVGIHYRVLGVMDRDTMIWFWIGTHADYDRAIRSL